MDDAGTSIIKNSELLSTTPARAALLSIAEAGYCSIQTPHIIEENLSRTGDILTVAGRTYDLSEYEHVYVLAVGKCSLDAAPVIASILGNRLTKGVCIDVRTGPAPARMQLLEGTHPYASVQNAVHTKTLLEVAEQAGAHDLVLVLVSGGGSALLCQPATHTPRDEAELIRHLFKGGATITELNIVRKHLSKARGGMLAAAAYPAEVATLIFSDVPGDDMAIIASGPTLLDTTTIEDARQVLEKYHADRIGFSPDHLIETPKEKQYFQRVHNVLALTNMVALIAMKAQAEALGYTAFIRDVQMQGDAHAIADLVVTELHTARPRTVLLYGGESTVTITGPGKGGRNQELSLAALETLQDDELLCSLASDGRDYTDHAGGIADVHTRTLARAQGLRPADYLYTNDSFTFFHTLQQGVVTGYTGSNIADLIIGMKHAAPDT
jgi:glycerate 2-kinase